jgi:hypothetical protein
MKAKTCRNAVVAWWIVGGMAALGAAMMFVRELPSMRREVKLMRM